MIWDLFENRDVSPKVAARERVLDVTPDGSRYTVMAADGIEHINIELSIKNKLKLVAGSTSAPDSR